MCKSIELCKQELAESYEEFLSRGQEIEVQKREELGKRIEKYKNASVSKAKAQAIAALLEQAELFVHPEELFALRIAHGGVMREFLWERYQSLRARCRSREAAALEEKKAIKAEMDFGHVSPDWDYLLSRGLAGVAEDLRQEEKKHSEDKRAYYEERIAVYEAMQGLFSRFADCAPHTEKGRFVAENLRFLSQNPPQTMAQAMQLILLYYVLQTQVDTVIVRSLGGLDRLLSPFYRSDRDSGRYSSEQLKEVIKHFLYQISLMKVTANLPFYIGGHGEAGDQDERELTLLLLTCYRELDIYDPKIHVMYHKNTDPVVLRLILEMIREGKNSFVFINYPLAVGALEKIGIAPEDARRLTVYGCYETAAEGTEVPCTCAGMINLVAPLEELLFGEEEFSSFEALLERVLEKLEENTRLCMDTIAAYEPHFGKVCPSLMMSPTFRSSREQGVDVYEGGAKYNNTSVVGAGLATLTDSLTVIKRAVFEEKSMTLFELREILKRNWEGAELLRQSLRKRCAHFGNNDAEADGIAQRIYLCFASCINQTKNARGGVFRCGVFSVDWREWMGKKTLATPDGRLAGEPISKNLAPCTGQDKKGVTAYLQSLLKLDATQMPDGGVADVVLHGSTVRGEEGLQAFHALLKTFMNGGGFAVHFNILRPEELKKAQKEPEKYKNLQIRLCGWNARFVELSRTWQDEFIKQSENGM